MIHWIIWFSMAVFIAAYCDGARRGRTVTKGGRSRRSYLPPRDWFRQRLNDVGGNGFDVESLYSLAPDQAARASAGHLLANAKVHALLQLEAGECSHGSLTNVGVEEKLLMDYYETPLDYYSARIVKCVKIHGDERISHAVSQHTRHYGSRKLSTSTPLVYPIWSDGLHSGVDGVKLLTESGDVLNYSTLVSTWGLTSALHKVPLLLLPWPIVNLITEGKWSMLVILARWHAGLHQVRLDRPIVSRLPGPCAGWPPPDALLWQHLGHNSSDLDASLDEDARLLRAESMKLTSSICSDFAGKLRAWSGVILDQAPDAPNQDVRKKDLVHMVETLDLWSESLEGQAGRNERLRYESGVVLAIFDFVLKVLGLVASSAQGL